MQKESGTMIKNSTNEENRIDFSKREIPHITHKASERPQCEYCKKGVLHQHIVIIDKGIVNYMMSLGDLKKKEKVVLDPNCPYCGSKNIYYTCGKDFGKGTEFGQHQCDNCKTAWCDYIETTIRKRLKWKRK